MLLFTTLAHPGIYGSLDNSNNTNVSGWNSKPVRLVSQCFYRFRTLFSLHMNYCWIYASQIQLFSYPGHHALLVPLSFNCEGVASWGRYPCHKREPLQTPCTEQRSMLFLRNSSWWISLRDLLDLYVLRPRSCLLRNPSANLAFMMRVKRCENVMDAIPRYCGVQYTYICERNL